MTSERHDIKTHKIFQLQNVHTHTHTHGTAADTAVDFHRMAEKNSVQVAVSTPKKLISIFSKKDYHVSQTEIFH